MNSAVDVASADSSDTDLIQESVISGKEKYFLKSYAKGRSDVWKSFKAVFYKDNAGHVKELRGVCACTKCKKVYRFQDRIWNEKPSRAYTGLQASISKANVT